MTLPRSAELRWQQEVIERWLITRSVPFDAREGLLELLKCVNEEMENLESAQQLSPVFDPGCELTMLQSGVGVEKLWDSNDLCGWCGCSRVVLALASKW
jgi:hypothetical protein